MYRDPGFAATHPANETFRRLTSFCFIMVVLFLFGATVNAAQGSAAPAPAKKSAGPLKVLRITPSGEDVPTAKKVLFEFDRPVVPLGRMERRASEIPITIEPAVTCNWRWENVSTLACQVSDKTPLVPATRYTITVQPGITTRDGETLSEAATLTFVTERPRIAEARFKTWQSPAMPLIKVFFQQPVSRKSVEDHLFFLTGGNRFSAEVREDPDQQKGKGYKENVAWLLFPKSELPADKAIDLMVEPGIVPETGREPGVESRAVLSFRTFPEFRFLGVECLDNAGNRLWMPLTNAGAAQSKCKVSEEIALVFSSPIIKEELKGGLQITPGIVSRSGSDPWAEGGSFSRLDELFKEGDVYSLPLPYGLLRPFTTYRLKADKGAMADEFGRPLSEPIDFSFSTDHRLPDFDLPKELPVLEKGLDTEVPVTLTNIHRLHLEVEVLPKGAKTGVTKKTLQPDVPKDTVATVPLGVRELVARPSGLVAGTVTSEPPVESTDDGPVRFFAQVTPFQVHLKMGHHNSLVWITDLQTGEPVADVEVQVLQDTVKRFGEKPRPLAKAATQPNGIAELPGLAVLDPELKLLWPSKPDEPQLFVRCQKGEDLAVLPLRYEFQVSSEGPNREYIPEHIRPLHGHIRTWGTTAQGIYRLGDEVQYKIYVRDQDNQGFAAAPRSGYQVQVKDAMDKVIHERSDLVLNDFGAFHGTFSIPKNGVIGWYRVVLKPSFRDEEMEPMRFLVSDFNPAPFKVTTELNGQHFGIGDQVKATTLAKLHAGGPFAGAAAKLTAMVEARPFELTDPKLRSFQFDTFAMPREEYEPPKAQTIYDMDGTLNDAGLMENPFTVTETPVFNGRLTVESAVRDDRGKTITGRASARYLSRDRFVGLFESSLDLVEGRPGRVQFAVIDPDGKPVTGVPIRVKIEHKLTRASRVKGAGDAYLTQYVHEWLEEGPIPDLHSTLEPGSFEFTPRSSGSYRITATLSDTQGRTHETTLNTWVVGKSYVLWESPAGNVLDLFPEKSEYHVGETARVLVQNPFPGAQALISVERFGVIKSWSKQLKNSTETIELPILPEYLPGFYLSVMVVSPRIEKPLKEGAPGDAGDLGKPTFRMGYAQITVTDPYKQIQVRAKADKEVYKPRETVTVDLAAQLRNPVRDKAGQPIELAVVVLDEAVLDLLKEGKETFDPYRGFYKLDSLDLANYNLLMQLVGRQKFEKKGANPGGGGGPDLALRSVFKFVSYWNPSVVLDQSGKAQIQFQAPDNLTGWRVLAMAVTPGDRMGLGEGSFKVSRPTEIRPVLPNQVLEGDSFAAGFSVMNRTDTARTLEVTLHAEGPVTPEAAGGGADRVEKISLPPFERQTIRFPLKTSGTGEITFIVRAGDERDSDAVKQALPVKTRQSLEAVASYGSSTTGETTEKVHFPDKIRPGAGGIRTTISPTLIHSLSQVFTYMRDYPFLCWEQIISKAAAAAAFQQLKQYFPKSADWEENRKTVLKTIDLAMEHQAPNGGMVYYIPKDRYVDPYLSAYTALVFNRLREGGFAIPPQVEKKLDEYLDTLLRRDDLPDFYQQGMAFDVRAVILAAFAEKGKLSREDLDRFARHIPDMSLFGRAHFLTALARSGRPAPLLQKVLRSILDHAEYAGGGVFFQESLDSSYRHMLASSVRDNAAILLGFLALERAGIRDASLKTIAPQLAHSLMQKRDRRGHWPSTQENVFAVMALQEFSRLYETQPPHVTVQAWLGSEKLGEGTFSSVQDPPLQFERGISAGDLGRQVQLKIQRQGEGRLYFNTLLTCSPVDEQREPVNAGMEILREYSVNRDGRRVLLPNPMEVKTGEVVRVDLFLQVPADRHFVVMTDPLPGGLEAVSADLATTSVRAEESDEARVPEGSIRQRFDDWQEQGMARWGFYHRELRFDSARFYSEYLPQGRYHVTYEAQAIAPGEFAAMPPRAEEMYAPEVFGKGSWSLLRVDAPK